MTLSSATPLVAKKRLLIVLLLLSTQAKVFDVGNSGSGGNTDRRTLMAEKQTKSTSNTLT